MLPLYLSNPDTDAAILASRIELGLAEIKAGITTERILRNRLKKHLIHTPMVSQSYPYQTNNEDAISTSSNMETNLDWIDPSPSWSSVSQVVNVL
jgi:hypothetical protein